MTMPNTMAEMSPVISTVFPFLLSPASRRGPNTGSGEFPGSASGLACGETWVTIEGMLERFETATRLPAQNLDRARAFYKEKLGLTPVEERPGGLLYQCGGSRFALFGSAGRATGEHTQMAWTVDDIEAVV